MRSVSSAMASADRVVVPLTRTFWRRLLMPAFPRAPTGYTRTRRRRRQR